MTAMTAANKRVYIAGPYSFMAPGLLSTRGQKIEHIKRAAEIAEIFRCAGWVPFLPHAHYDGWNEALGGRIFGGISGHGEIMAQCLKWVEACDALVRLPGYSPGSDSEAAHAILKGIPVIPAHRIGELIREDPGTDEEEEPR